MSDRPYDLAAEVVTSAHLPLLQRIYQGAYAPVSEKSNRRAEALGAINPRNSDLFAPGKSPFDRGSSLIITAQTPTAHVGVCGTRLAR